MAHALRVGEMHFNRDRTLTQPGYQAFRILQLGFVVAPIVAGVDKFFNWLTNWTQYVAPQITQALSMSARGFMMLVGVVEVAAGVLVLLKPKIGAYVVCAWLLGIIGNLLLLGGFYDVALRDLGLALGALALGRLSQIYSR
jgi:uncharacterized membrane protein HdeD (DUF308 family)